MKLYQVWEKGDEGFVFDEQKFKEFVSHLYDGRYLITFQQIEPKSDEKTYRSCYFAKLDVLSKETGNAKYDLHEYVKQNILGEMLEKGEPLTTAHLSLEQWRIFLDQFDIWAFTEFNIILP